MLYLSLKIKQDSKGPVFYRQKRIGRNGAEFEILKFRTMYFGSENGKPKLSSPNDERITNAGRLLRKYRLDEIPQFWNVLKGDMSIVGTRPPLISETNLYEPRHKVRLAIKPGITGMWQVSGRSDITDFEEVVKLDMKYIANWNFGLDIKILFKTVMTVLKREGSV